MRKICKINFSKIKLNKNRLVSARKIESKTKTLNKKRKKERKMKMTAMSDGSQLRRLIHSFTRV